MTRREEIKVLIKDVRSKLLERAKNLNESQVADDTELRFIDQEVKQLRRYYKTYKKLE